ncbi:GRAM domain-containing protein 3 [Pteropus alecto]|uniref:GRAM domain-containing protein 3 n=1 Tax=Pteropus alecto TaxID=9402 RepID=L5KM13_PTEAL|nr:GRAM domain-containing protein 3 [Pteropus alecto]
MDKYTMVKKRLSSSDMVFRFETPGSPRKIYTETSHSSTNSPGSVFLRVPFPPLIMPQKDRTPAMHTSSSLCTFFSPYNTLAE